MLKVVLALAWLETTRKTLATRTICRILISGLSTRANSSHSRTGDVTFTPVL
jgi:hypothetical protein